MDDFEDNSLNLLPQTKSHEDVDDGLQTEESLTEPSVTFETPSDYENQEQIALISENYYSNRNIESGAENIPLTDFSSEDSSTSEDNSVVNASLSNRKQEEQFANNIEKQRNENLNSELDLCENNVDENCVLEDDKGEVYHYEEPDNEEPNNEDHIAMDIFINNVNHTHEITAPQNGADVASTEDDIWITDNLLVGENIEADQFKLEPEDDQINLFVFNTVSQNHNMEQNFLKLNTTSNAVVSCSKNNVAIPTENIATCSNSSMHTLTGSEVLNASDIDADGASSNEALQNDKRDVNRDLLSLSKLRMMQKSEAGVNKSHTPLNVRNNVLQSTLSKQTSNGDCKETQKTTNLHGNMRSASADGFQRDISLREPSPGRIGQSRLPLPVMCQKKQQQSTHQEDSTSSRVHEKPVAKNNNDSDKSHVIKNSKTISKERGRSISTCENKVFDKKSIVIQDDNKHTSNTSTNNKQSVYQLDKTSEIANTSSVTFNNSISSNVTGNITNSLQADTVPPTAVSEMQNLCGQLKQLTELSTQAFGGTLIF